jgi:heme-degrading monooxygenase HmoA
MTAEPVVRLHLWGVDDRHVPSAFIRMGAHRLALRRMARRPDGPTFAKLLGTARPTTFGPSATDPHHWGLLTVWRSAAHADAFDDSPVARSWALIATESARIGATPVASRGQWSRREPFGRPVPSPIHGPVAALTRARIRTGHLRDFWAQSEQVAGGLADSDGVMLATGIGEAPVALQGTISIWRTVEDMNRFARHESRHVEAMRKAPTDGWYAEELFARLRVDHASGTFAGIELSDIQAEVEEASAR